MGAERVHRLSGRRRLDVRGLVEHRARRLHDGHHRALDLRYYDYRAEVEGGTFDGEGYYFCTSPDAYTIVGDANCRARGYDEEEFAEIDVEDYTSFTLTLVDTSAPPPPPVRDTGKPPAAETSKGTTDVPTFERKVTPRPPRGN
ncbi:MAG: DUF1036 domain-containing protein [Paracoccaceae bacterium]